MASSKTSVMGIEPPSRVMLGSIPCTLTVALGVRVRAGGRARDGGRVRDAGEG